MVQRPHSELRVENHPAAGCQNKPRTSYRKTIKVVNLLKKYQFALQVR